jgi:hypothetical protein
MAQKYLFIAILCVKMYRVNKALGVGLNDTMHMHFKLSPLPSPYPLGPQGSQTRILSMAALAFKNVSRAAH